MIHTIYLEIEQRLRTIDAKLTAAELTVRIHLVQERYSEGFENSRDKDDYMRLLHVPRFVFAGLQGFRGTKFTGLLRRRDQPSVSHDAVYVHTIDFVTIVQDDTASMLAEYINSDGNHPVQVTYDQTLDEYDFSDDFSTDYTS